jgi:hypothetical protein
VVWRLTRDPALVLQAVRATLAAGGHPAATAAALVPELVPVPDGEQQELVRLLHLRLGDRWARVEAARALWRLATEPGVLTGPLVAEIADGGAWRAALDLLVDLRAADAIPALRDLADRDTRIPVLGGAEGADGIVWEDEWLRAAIQDAIERLA